MTENKGKQNYGSLAQLVLAGASTVLGVIPGTAAVGGMVNIALFTWIQENQKKFEHQIKEIIKNLDESKLDTSALESDEFKELVIQSVDFASQSASELKRRTLAQALVNSVIPPTSKFSSKQTLLRILSLLSDEEMLVLGFIRNIEMNISFAETLPPPANPYEKNRATSLKDFLGVKVVTVAKKLNWSEEEAFVTCESLRQLRLVNNPLGDRVLLEKEDSTNLQNQNQHYRTTLLAQKLLRWCSEEVPTT